MIRSLSGIVKWLVFTNFYIALAAACFQLVIVVLVDKMEAWNWALTAHTFSSTWMVYQFSRWNFNRGTKGHGLEGSELYAWHARHPRFTLSSVVAGGVASVATLAFLRTETLLILAVLGAVSLVYPLRLGTEENKFSLRSIPFAKIFLIAFVWAGMSVWVPLAELGYPPFEHLDRFAFHFCFIFFITLPFDIVDLRTDRATRVKTLPAWLGLRRTKVLIVFLGLLLIAYETLRMAFSGPYIGDYLAYYIFLIATLALFAVAADEKTAKWKIMAVFDGSMILLFLITLLFHRIG